MADPDSNDKPRDKFPSKSDLLTVWMHQNDLIWGRLQTLAILQIAVIGGWYVLCSAPRISDAFLALLLAFLGAILSTLVLMLINCDVAWRDALRKEMGDLVKPPTTRGRGKLIIRFITGMFIGIDLVLTIVALIILVARIIRFQNLC